MKTVKMFLIGFIIWTVVSCKPSLCEPEATRQTCDFPKRLGLVNDYCGFLTADENQKIDQIITDFRDESGTEIIIVVEDSKKSHSRKFHVPCEIAKRWQLEVPQKFDDFLIVISRKRTYVDFTYGLEFNNKLTREEHNYLLHKIMVPAFQKKKYSEGLVLGIDYVKKHFKNKT